MHLPFQNTLHHAEGAGQVFTADLLVTAPRWTQQWNGQNGCASHTMEYYAARKKNQRQTYEFSETSRHQKDTLYHSTYTKFNSREKSDDTRAGVTLLGGAGGPPGAGSCWASVRVGVGVSTGVYICEN